MIAWWRSRHPLLRWAVLAIVVWWAVLHPDEAAGLARWAVHLAGVTAHGIGVFLGNFSPSRSSS